MNPTYTTEEFIEMLKAYDFVNNSMASFTRKYYVSEKTIKRYLVKYKINHRTKAIRNTHPKDPLTGKFILNINRMDAFKDTSYLKDTSHLANDISYLNKDTPHLLKDKLSLDDLDYMMKNWNNPNPKKYVK